MNEDLVWKELKPIKEVEPGWWKLKWKPVKNGTYNIFLSGGKSYNAKQFGIRFWRGGAHNGWGRDYDGFAIEIGFWWTLNIWINFNFVKKIATDS